MRDYSAGTRFHISDGNAVAYAHPSVAGVVAGAAVAVGLGTDQIKTGSLSRSERIAKYNELIRIADTNSRLGLAHPFTSV